MERRSAKRTTPRRKYTVDAFEGVEELEAARSDHGTPNGRDDQDESADEFAAAAEASPEEDEMSDLENNMDVDESDAASDAGERLLDGTMSIAEDQDDSVLAQTTLPDFSRMSFVPKYRQKRGTWNTDGIKTYSRGVLENVDNKSAKGARQLYYYGPSKENESPISKAKAHWAQQPTLPSRTTDSKGLGGMHRSFFADESILETEASRAQKWWNDDGGKDAFLEKQILQSIDQGEAAQYMSERQSGAVSFVMGPHGKQHLFKLAAGEHVTLHQAWSKDDSSLPSDYKSGFMLNLGAKVHCIHWASDQDGSAQYLVTSALPDRKRSHPPNEAPQAPAFAPQPPDKSNVQVWKFVKNEQGYIDTSIEPALHTVLCTAWGDAKALKWCPECLDGSEQFDDESLGLLAGVWADGAVRVLELPSISESEGTNYLQVNRVAFESRPPNTILTCLTWLGSTRVAAGCANGCIAIWDLPTAFQASSPNPRPVIYSSVASSYILSIESCSPSRPNFILVNTMDGYIAMVDLSRSGQSLCSPASTIFSSRNRVAQPRMIWYDFAQMAMHIDDSFTLLGSTIRRLFKTFGLGRYRSHATCLAASPCHPFVLAGTANGEVVSTSPLNRALNAKAIMWQQIWFAHEWRRPIANEAQANGVSNEAPEAPNDTYTVAHTHGVESQEAPEAGTPGLSRILEGFKVERIKVLTDECNTFNVQDGTVFTTIYEERSAITALAWNPNTHVGGWAAAGMGDGLLRVEDIAI